MIKKKEEKKYHAGPKRKDRLYTTLECKTVLIFRGIAVDGKPVRTAPIRVLGDKVLEIKVG